MIVNGTYLPIDLVPYCRKLESSSTLPWEEQSSQLLPMFRRSSMEVYLTYTLHSTISKEQSPLLLSVTSHS